ncbi:MAG: beta-class phenol-soluble modulin [Staphylococcus epidermidis]|nr:beta-class phenol-soluble modulin [Staphylococcus epidermidis]
MFIYCNKSNYKKSQYFEFIALNFILFLKNLLKFLNSIYIYESLHNAVNAGLHVKQDWVDMGFGIADTVAKIVDQVLKFV